MASLTEQDLEVLAERFGDIAWSVYVQGLDELFTHEIPDADDEAAGNRPLTRESAIAFAEQITEDSRSLSALHGVETPELVPFVLCHGIV